MARDFFREAAGRADRHCCKTPRVRDRMTVGSCTRSASATHCLAPRSVDRNPQDVDDAVYRSLVERKILVVRVIRKAAVTRGTCPG